jgi:hypothetical protein
LWLRLVALEHFTSLLLYGTFCTYIFVLRHSCSIAAIDYSRFMIPNRCSLHVTCDYTVTCDALKQERQSPAGHPTTYRLGSSQTPQHQRLRQPQRSHPVPSPTPRSPLFTPTAAQIVHPPGPPHRISAPAQPAHRQPRCARRCTATCELQKKSRGVRKERSGETG